MNAASALRLGRPKLPDPADPTVAVGTAGTPRGPGSATSDRLLRRLEWTVLRRLDGLLQGDYRTLMRGLGLDFADLREYQPGDDVRHIDWNVTARQQTAYVRRFHEARDINVWLLLDLSPSVHFGSGAQSKFGLAQELAAVLARIFSSHGNRVGAIIYGRRDAQPGDADRVLHVLPPRASRLQVLQILQAMESASPTGGKQAGAEPSRATAAPPPRRGWRDKLGWLRRAGRDATAASRAPQTTELAGLLRAAQHTLRQRSTVLVVSDFISEPGWEAALGQLAQRHEVLAVRLTDPLDRVLPDFGLLTLADAETGEHLLVDANDPAFRERYVVLAAAQEAGLLQALTRAGVDTLELATDADLAAALARFCALRRQRSRLGGGATQAPRAGRTALEWSTAHAQEHTGPPQASAGHSPPGGPT